MLSFLRKVICKLSIVFKAEKSLNYLEIFLIYFIVCIFKCIIQILFFRFYLVFEKMRGGKDVFHFFFLKTFK